MILSKIINKKTFFIFFAIFFILNVENYPGNKFLFLIYSLFSYFLFLTIIRKKINYFELFFFSFLLLGFWLKPTSVLFFDSLNFTEGDINYIENIYEVYNDTFYVIIVVFSACIMGSFLREYLQNKFYNKKEYKIKLPILTFYKKYRYIILFLYIIGSSLLWLTNTYFQIYAKGIVNNQIPFLVKNLFAWCFNYGLSAMTAIYIYIDVSIYKQKKIILLGLFETYFTNLSILSRAFLLIFLVYLKGFIDLISKLKLNFSFSKYFLLNLILIIFFFISAFLYVENARNTKYINPSADNNLSNHPLDSKFFKKSFINISTLVTTRWVGIDSLLAVSNSKDKSFNLIINALTEKRDHQKPSFYMKHFFKSFKFEEDLSHNLNIVILPGIVAFLYYSGSYILVFIGIIFFILFFSFMELIFFRYSNNNNILGSIIGFTLAWRLVHFGYLPLNTLQFLFSFLLTFIVILLISKFIWKK